MQYADAEEKEKEEKRSGVRLRQKLVSAVAGNPPVGRTTRLRSHIVGRQAGGREAVGFNPLLYEKEAKRRTVRVLVNRNHYSVFFLR